MNDEYLQIVIDSQEAMIAAQEAVLRSQAQTRAMRDKLALAIGALTALVKQLPRPEVELVGALSLGQKTVAQPPGGGRDLRAIVEKNAKTSDANIDAINAGNDATFDQYEALGVLLTLLASAIGGADAPPPLVREIAVLMAKRPYKKADIDRIERMLARLRAQVKPPKPPPRLTGTLRAGKATRAAKK